MTHDKIVNQEKRLTKLSKPSLLWREVEADSRTGSIETFLKVEAPKFEKACSLTLQQVFVCIDTILICN